MPRITLDVWSDFVCPFCYLEAPVLDALRAEFGDALDIQWRAFELRPDPVPTLDPRGDYLRDAWKNHVYPMAEERGMRLRLPPVQPRSRLAFEAELFAREHGLGDKMRLSLFQAFFEHGRDIGKISVLTSIGRAIGLNAARLKFALQNGDFTGTVHADRREAELLGVRGVPAMRLRSSSGRQRLITGAQTFEALREQVAMLLADEIEPDLATRASATCRARPETALAHYA
ncbi:MAG: DsbA family oxidoreductase [Zoogloeaceae bacterium]|nr:DsbA family oxidoreductase [Zoogloeaceae bacterium]